MNIVKSISILINSSNVSLLDKDQAKYVIIVTGPTAVGKTELSIALAEKYGAEIFSCDSRQLYHEMNIGTAKPTTEELARVNHHFVNHRSIHNGYSVGDYYREMQVLLETYFQTHDVAIMTGGTGMYIHAITDGLHDYPEVSPEVIQGLEETLEAGGIEYLQQELKEVDPEYYEKVDIQNPMRLIRALSVIHESGETFTSFQQQQKAGLPYTFIPVLLTRDRDELYERINMRVELMMQEGLVAEAKSLYPYQDLKSLNTVGYNELFMYFQGIVDMVTAIDLIKRNSRRYAKRQMTWFRKYGDWASFHPDDKAKIETYIDEQLSKE